MSWVLFVLLAANMWAVGNIIDKHVISRRVRNPMLPVSIQSVSIFAYSLLMFFILGISVPSYFQLLLSLLIGILWFLSVSLYYRALKKEEVSRVVPLYGMTTVFTLIIATIFLGEIFTLEKYLGVAMLIMGSFLISYRHNKIRNKISGALGLIAGASLLYSVSYTIIKYLSFSMNFLSIFILAEISFSAAAFISLFVHRNEAKEIYNKSKKTVIFITLAGTLGFLGFLAFFAAISQGPVSLVNSLDNIQNFFTLFYATILSIFIPHILKEELKGSVIALKLLAIAIIFAGAYLVSV